MMSVEVGRSDLCKRFGKHIREIQNQDEIIDQCAQICRVYNMTPEELYYKWEAYSIRMNSQESLNLSLEQVEELKKALQTDLERSASAMNRSVNGFDMSPNSHVGTPLTAKKPGGLRGVGLEFLQVQPGRSSPVTPMGKRSSNLNQGHNITPVMRTPSTFGSNRAVHPYSSPLSHSLASSPNGAVDLSSSNKNFSTRTNRNTIQETLNPHIAAKDISEKSKPYTLSFNVGPKEFDYRYMYEKIRARSAALDHIIEQSASRFSLPDAADFADPSLASPDENYYIGRVCLDTASAQGKLNEHSILLQAARSHGGSYGTRLNFEEALGKQSLSLFAGQIICVRGLNATGKEIVVKEILKAEPLEFAATDEEALSAMSGTQTKNGLVVASGPYTLNDDLAYEPMEDLCSTICTDAPDFVILLGPFVDRRHPILLSGNVEEFPEDIFRRGVLEKLNRVARNLPQTTFIMIPSTDDLISDHIVFPQAPLSRELCTGFDALGKERLRLAPNPVIFSLDEVSIAVSSVDALRDIGREELHRPATLEQGDADGAAPDRMARLAKHMIEQGSFYPIFPANTASELPLDVTHHHLLTLPANPDIFIMPSLIRSFAKIVDSCVIVNPGHLAKKQSGGTYAKMTIRPLTAAEIKANSEAGECSHALYSRTRVEIVRI